MRSKAIITVLIIAILLFPYKIYGEQDTYILIGPSPNSLIDISLGSLVLTYGQSVWISSNQNLHFKLIDPLGKIRNASQYISNNMKPIKIYTFTENDSAGIWTITFSTSTSQTFNYNITLVDNRIYVSLFNYSSGLYSNGLSFSYFITFSSKFLNLVLIPALVTNSSFLNYTNVPIIAKVNNVKNKIGYLVVNQGFSQLNGNVSRLIFSLLINYLPNSTLKVQTFDILHIEISKYLVITKKVGNSTAYFFFVMKILKNDFYNYEISKNVSLNINPDYLSTGLIYVKINVYRSDLSINSTYTTTMLSLKNNGKVSIFNILSSGTSSNSTSNVELASSKNCIGTCDNLNYKINNTVKASDAQYNYSGVLSMDYTTLSQIFLSDQVNMLKNIYFALIEEENNLFGVSLDNVVHPISMISFYNKATNQDIDNYVMLVNNSAYNAQFGRFIFIDKEIKNFYLHLYGITLSSRMLNISEIPFIPFTYQIVYLTLYAVNFSIKDENGLIKNSTLIVKSNNLTIINFTLPAGSSNFFLPFGTYQVEAKAFGHYNISLSILINSNKNIDLYLTTIKSSSTDIYLYFYLVAIISEAIACAYLIRKILLNKVVKK